MSINSMVLADCTLFPITTKISWCPHFKCWHKSGCLKYPLLSSLTKVCEVWGILSFNLNITRNFFGVWPNTIFEHPQETFEEVVGTVEPDDDDDDHVGSHGAEAIDNNATIEHLGDDFSFHVCTYSFSAGFWRAMSAIISEMCKYFLKVSLK